MQQKQCTFYIRNPPRKKHRKRHFADYIVYLAIIAVIGYTVTAFVLQFLPDKIEISPTLTTCWYAFWGTELITLATIKNCKTKHNKNKEDDY